MKRIYQANCRQEASDLAEEEGHKVILVEFFQEGVYIVHTEES